MNFLGLKLNGCLNSKESTDHFKSKDIGQLLVADILCFQHCDKKERMLCFTIPTTFLTAPSARLTCLIVELSASATYTFFIALSTQIPLG